MNTQIILVKIKSVSVLGFLSGASNHPLNILSRLRGFLCAAVVLQLVSASSGAPYGTGVALRGINRAGAEYGADWYGWTGQTYYAFPNGAVSGAYSGSAPLWAAELAYYASKGFNMVRFPIAWERVQHTLNGSLDATYVANLTSCIAQATSAGFSVVLDLHNYGRYATGAWSGSSQSGGYTQHVIGDGTLTVSHLADVWTKLANLFLSNPNVIFEIMNEPHDLPMTSTTFFAGMNTVITAIRATGSSHLILVPNTRGSDVDHWSVYSPGGGPLDSVAALSIADSGNNFAFAMHAYQDNPSSSTSYSMLIANVTNWAMTNGKKLFLTEMGSVNTAAQGFIAIGGLFSYMNSHSSVWLGISPWNLMPYNLSNSTYTTDAAAMAWYTPYMTPYTTDGTGYATWRQFYFGNVTSAEGAPDFDGDEDGVINTAEFAFNMDPRVLNAGTVSPEVGTNGLPAFGQTWVGGQPRITLEYIRRKTGVTYEVRASSDVGNLQPIAALVIEGPISVSVDYERIKVADVVNMNDPAFPQHFLQIHVSIP